MSKQWAGGACALRVVGGAAVVGGVACAPSATGAVDWAQWGVGTQQFPHPNTSGTLAGGFLSVVYNGSALFRQIGAGTDFWSPSTPYLSASVPNAPTPAHMIAVADFASSHSLSFASPVTNPVMALVGLGSATTQTQWAFDAPFQILSAGVGFFGGAGTLTNLGANTLEGDEGSGVIQFIGTFTSISWTITGGEQPWTDETLITGITVGLIPAPGASVAFGAAALLAGRRRRR